MAAFDPRTHDWKPLVPELMVSDIAVSLAFWCKLLGFRLLYERPAERWYGAGAQQVGQRQFLVQDPDGYLLRFAQGLGVRS